MTDFDNLTYLHGKPQGHGVLKASPEDFLVVEDLGFEPDGEGEHILVRILKNGCNTRFVADALAKFLKIHAREVSFAGQKDKHAVTEQWLCARVPGNAMPDLSKFELEGCKVLEYARHKRKLRLGALKGNDFTLVLREVTDRDDVEKRLNAISAQGVPNYFGAQRFGIGGSNLQGALRWAQSDAPVRDRNKRSCWRCATISGTRKLVCGNGRRDGRCTVARGRQSADDYRRVARYRRLGNPGRSPGGGAVCRCGCAGITILAGAGKSRRSTPRDAALSAAVKLELVG